MEKAPEGDDYVSSMTSRAKWIRMVVLALGFMGTGSAYAVPGPSLIDLEIRMSTGTKEITLMFLLRACGGLIGSLVSGYLYDVISADVILAVVEVAAGGMIIAAPWWQSHVGLSFCLGFSGLCGAMVNIGVMTYCASMWGRSNLPYMMLLAFLSSTMTSAIPPIVRALLLPSRPPIYHQGGLNTTLSNLTSAELLNNNLLSTPVSSLLWNGTADGTENTLKYTFTPDDVQVQYAFLLPGACFILASIGHTLLATSRKCSRRPIFITQRKSHGARNNNKKTLQMARWKIITFLVSFGFLTANIGALSETYSMFLFSFLVKHWNWSKLDAVWPLLVLSTSNFIAQVIFLGLGKCLRSSIVMGILQAAMLLSTILMCLPIITHHPLVFWISIALCEISFGPTGGTTIISWMSNELGTSGKITSFVFAIVYATRILTSHMVGYLFDTHGPIWFVYMNVISVGVATVAYGVIVLLTEVRRQKHRYVEDHENAIEMAMLAEHD